MEAGKEKQTQVSDIQAEPQESRHESRHETRRSEVCFSQKPGTHPVSGIREETDKNTTVAVATVVPMNGPVQQVFTHWQTAMQKPRAVLDDKRKKAVAARLKEGYSVADLCQAIDGCRASAWHMGQNDRRRPFNDLELICRSAGKVEQFRQFIETGQAASAELNDFLRDPHDFIDGECSHG